jgi:hypothetical protein
MFGFGKKKKKGKTPAKPANREELLAQARANAAAAREEIGDETLDKIREAMMRKQNSPIEQARAKIKALDQARIADNIRYVRDEDKG